MLMLVHNLMVDNQHAIDEFLKSHLLAYVLSVLEPSRSLKLLIDVAHIFKIMCTHGSSEQIQAVINMGVLADNHLSFSDDSEFVY